MSDFDDASALDALLADVEDLPVDQVVSTPVPAARGKSTSGGGGAKRLTTLFRSPSSFAVAAGCVTEGSSPPVCMGLIGTDGLRFCVLKGCTTKKHSHNKFEASPNHLFIKSSPNQVYCSPCVDAAKITVGQVVELMTLSKTVEDWVNVFGVLQSAEEEVTLDEVERRLEFLDHAKSHRTPAKEPRMSESAFHAADMEDMLEDIPDEITKASSYAWNPALPVEFTPAVEVLGRVVTSLASTVPTALSESSLRVAKATRSMEEVHDQLNARLISVEGTVGEREDENEGIPPTIWGSIRLLFDRASQESTPATVATTASSPDPDISVGGRKKVLDGLEALQRQRDRDTRKHGELAAKLSSHMLQVKTLFGSITTKLASVVKAQNDMTNEVNRLSASGGGGSTGGRAPDGLEALLAGFSEEPSSEVEALRKEVRELRKVVEQSKDEGGDEAVEMAGLKFHNREELGAWIAENVPNLPVGAYVGFHGLMQQIYFDTKGYEQMQSILKSLQLKSDMGLKTNGDALVLAAIRSAIPAVFGEGKPPTGNDRSAFHAIHTFDDWKNPNGRDGFSNDFMAKRLQAEEGIRMEAETRLDPGSPAFMLAETCLSKSTAFADAFVLFLTKTCEELIQASGFPKKKAWALTTSLGKRICQEVHKDSGSLARSLIVSKDEKEREQLCLLLLWATLREHKKMAEYIKHEFKDHSSVASEYVKFLATNSNAGLETVVDLKKQVDSLDKEVTALKKSNATLANSLDVTKKVAEEAKKAANRRSPG